MLSPATSSSCSSFTTSCISSPSFSSAQDHPQQQQPALLLPSPSATREPTAAGVEADGQQHQQCRICGDTAGCGLNFGCLSCESCKAFFRRCHTKSLGQHQQNCCPFSGQCQITKASRKACPACRLEKCVKVGMRIDMVDAWKKHWGKKKPKQPKEQQNGLMKKRKRNSSNTTIGCQDGDEKQHVCACGGRPRVVATNDKGCQTDEAFEEDNAKPTALSPSEQSLLDELIRANAVMETPLRLPQLMLPPFNPMTLLDALRVSELAMRRLVAMFKQLTAFRALDPRDQVTLLRGSLVQLLILRGAMAFDGHQAWRHAVLPSSSNVAGGGVQPLPFCVNFNVLPAEEQHSAEHKRFLTTFGEQWRTNKPVMLILHAIVLFSTVPSSESDETSLICKETVERLRAQYCALLQRYLLLLGHGHDEAYAHLMGKLDELRQLNASFQWLYSRLDPGELEPLLNELFSSSSAAAAAK